MKYNDNFPEIFANLKDGDCLGFFKGGPLYSLIPRATGGDCNHVGICWNVSRTKTSLSFNFSQQTFHGGKFDEVSIFFTEKGLITDDPYFVKQDAIYYRSLKETLTKKQIEIGIADAESQIGKKYGYLTLPLGVEFLEKIMPRFLKNFIIKKSEHMKRVCSTHAYFQYAKIGLIPFTKDFFITPIECLNFPFFKGN